ncbi:MAG: magnesium transporter CorA family protein [Acidimicrobiales bacterium]
MRCVLSAHGQVTEGATTDQIDAAKASGDFFWLDIDSGDGTDEDVGGLATLLGRFAFHPLAVEDAEQFDQRPKLDDYDDLAYMVALGAPPKGSTKLVEVHLFITATFVVSVHRGSCEALAKVRIQLERHHARDTVVPQAVLTYLVVDKLTDSFFPALAAFDETIDELEDEILRQPTEAQLGTIFDMKRQLMIFRRGITPQRDMFASLSGGVTDLPGTTDEAARYFRDLYDHLIRLSDMVDSYRDLLSGVMDTHLSTVSNRLNVVMKQLAIIATIFLPLSFLTGFFGQNFAVLVRWITPGWTFWVLGIGTELTAIVLLMVLFVRRGWLGGPTA